MHEYECVPVDGTNSGIRLDSSIIGNENVLSAFRAPDEALTGRPAPISLLSSHARSQSECCCHWRGV